MSRAKPAPILALLLLTLTSLAQPQTAQPTDASALVRRAIENREDATKTHRPLRYLLRKTDDHRDPRKTVEPGDELPKTYRAQRR